MIQNALFLCVVCALVFVFYLPSYVKMQDLNEKNRQYEKKIVALEKDNTRLEDERRRLTDDPAYFEKVARERMGIIRDGEVIYKVVASGQKKDGQNSEEGSFIIKQEKDDLVKKGTAVVSSSSTTDSRPTVKKKVKAAVKPATKPAVKLKNSSNKTKSKKSTKIPLKVKADEKKI